MDLSDRIDKIRYFINGPIRQHSLMKNTATWFQLCSCLDVLGDTELAINAYSDSVLDIGSLPKIKKYNVGSLYLEVYGLLQALFLQQDAAINLCDSLGIVQ